MADETPPAIDWLLMEQEPNGDPVVLKFTCNPLGAPDDMAVAVTVTVVLEIVTELGNEPRTIVWSFVRTAGTDTLWREVGSIGTGARVVDIV